MFSFLKSKPKGEIVTFKIDGMHCSSCALNIDGELEETDGVLSSNTSYAKAITKVEYDPETIQPKAILKMIKSTGYSASIEE